MASGNNHIDMLRRLPKGELEAEILQELNAALQELVACVEPKFREGTNTLHACVIDDLKIQAVEIGERECRVGLRFLASAGSGATATAAQERARITGQADAVIDANGRVRYHNVALVREAAPFGHDHGGGD